MHRQRQHNLPKYQRNIVERGVGQPITGTRTIMRTVVGRLRSTGVLAQLDAITLNLWKQTKTIVVSLLSSELPKAIGFMWLAQMGHSMSIYGLILALVG
jgi:hypothetical protein